VFNDRNYPNFERLLDRLGVASEPSEMSFSVSDGRGDFEYNGSSPNGLFAKRAHLITPWCHRMLAAVAKLDRVCERLEIGPEDQVLEVGTGWGGLAIHAARTRGCRVTTATISREQRDAAAGHHHR
jgi:hypothetical protein